MAAALGRAFIVKIGSDAIAALRTKSPAWSGESVDITTSDSEGYRTLLAESGQQQIDLAVDGILEDHILQDLAFGGGSTYFEALTLEWPIADSANNTAATLTGPFRLSGMDQTTTYNDAINFSGTIESAGKWVYTAETTSP